MKNCAISILILSAIYPVNVLADMQCGPFYVAPGPDDGYMRINGVKPDSQKYTFLKQQDDFNNVKFSWLVADHRKAQLYAMAYIKRDGEAHLDVQFLHNGVDDRPHIRSYDCVKVK